MTDRPIFTIDLDDSAFKEFAEKFRQFQAQAAAMPAQWRATGAAIGEAQAAIDGLALPDQSGAASGAGAIAEAFQAAGVSFSSVVDGAKKFGGFVRHATASLAKWSGLTALFSGILAAGGFWGISRTAAGVAARGASAARAGTTYGGATAAGAAFGRIGGVDSILAGLAEALHSSQGMAPIFSLMGAEAERLRGGDTADALAAILPKLKELADGANPGNLADRIRAMGLDRIGVSVETMKMLKGMSREEVGGIVSDYERNRSALELSPAAQKSLTDFTRLLESAGAKMAVIVGENLSHLTPIVGRAAEALARVIARLLDDGGPVAKWLEAADKKLVEFAGWIESREFLAVVDKFVKDVSDAGALFSAFAGSARSEIFGGETPPYRFQRRPTVQPDGSIKDETYEIGPDGEATPARPGHGRRMVTSPRGATRGGGFTPALPVPAAGEDHASLARRIQQVRPDLESEQCVALAKAMVGSRESVRTWRPGPGAMSGALVPGTPIATFLDRSGRPSSRYDGGGTGAPGNHTTHAAVFESYARDRGGRIVGINVWEQFKGSHGQRRKTYFAQGFGTNNAANYRAILDNSGRPLGGRRNPMSRVSAGAQNHVEVDDQSGGGARVSLDHVRIGPVPTPGFHHAFARRG
ncbi:MAG: hypothetical protein N2444_00035 [Methylocystis sp.]|nr:hypothetical protein [Methylocystis sp.]